MTTQLRKWTVIVGLLIGTVLGVIIAACMIGREIPGPFFAYWYTYTLKDFLLSCAGGVACVVGMGYALLKSLDRMG